MRWLTSLDVPEIARLAIVAATLIVLLAPRRWAILGLAVAASVDVVDSSLLNGLQHLALTSAFAWRMGCRPSHLWSVRPASLWWGGFVAYAALTTPFAPSYVDGVTMVGTLVGTMILVCGLKRAWANGSIRHVTLAAALLVVLGLGIVQTFALGNPYDSSGRFTALAQAQGFGFLVLVLGLATALTVGRVHIRAAWIAVTVLALTVNGSRSNVLALAFALLVLWVVTMHRKQLGPALLSLSILFTGAAYWYVQTIEASPEHRLGALVAAAQGDDSRAIGGTFHFRQRMYDATIEDITNRSAHEQVFGSGAASGGEVAIRHHIPGYGPGGHSDPNRMIHSEPLRVALELGVIGSALWLAAAFAFVRSCYRRNDRWALAGLGALLVLFTFENALVSGLSGFGLATALIIGWHYRDVSSSTLCTEPDDRDGTKRADGVDLRTGRGQPREHAPGDRHRLTPTS